MPFGNLLYGALYAGVASAVTSASFVFKNSTKEDMDWKKFSVTIIVAGLVGALTTFGFDPSMLQGALGSVVGLVVENLWKGVKKRKK